MRHPRHQHAGLGRRLHILWLHPHAERRYLEPPSTRIGRHPRDGDALIVSSRKELRQCAAFFVSAAPKICSSSSCTGFYFNVWFSLMSPTASTVGGAARHG